MSSKKNDFPENDPYEALGLQFGAVEAEVNKAYRKLARTLHPDKLAQSLSEAELKKAAARFQDIQHARDFLVKSEHAETRERYNAKRASAQLRKASEAAREKGMSERRKRMREELKQEEAAAMRKKPATKDLAKEGANLRQQYAQKTSAPDIQSTDKSYLKRQERQVRLKWSRKKLKAQSSPSEESIAKMLSLCGPVQEVQLIGGKGNVALVTFARIESTSRAVDEYADSDIWRATYVSKAKKREKFEEDLKSVVQKTSHRDFEGMSDWKARRDAEREAMLRKMQNGDEANSNRDKFKEPEELGSPFPPHFPSTEQYSRLVLPLQKLQLAEKLVLNGIVSSDSIQKMNCIQ